MNPLRFLSPVFLVVFIFYASQSTAATCNPQIMGGNHAHLPDSPGEMLLVKNGKWLVVTDKAGGTLKVADTQTQGWQETIILDDIRPLGLAVSQDDTKIYASGTYPLMGAPGNIAVIDISAEDPGQWSNKIWTIEGDFGAIKVSESGDQLYITDRQSNGVKVLSATDGQVQGELSVSHCDLPVDIVLYKEWAYVSCETSNRVSVFNTTTQTHEKDISIASPTALLLYAESTPKKIFVASQKSGQGQIGVINADTRELGQLLPSADQPLATNLLAAPRDLALLLNEISIVDRANETLVSLDPVTEELSQGNCQLSGYPQHIVVNTVNKDTPDETAYVYIAGGDNVEYTEVKIRYARLYPQVLMVGFDPMLIHKSDTEIKIMAVVEQGFTKIKDVSLAPYFIPMEVAGSLKLPSSIRLRFGERADINMLVYEATIPLDLSTFPEQCLTVGCSIPQLLGVHDFSLFGKLPGQFIFRARDESLALVHEYPDMKFGNYRIIKADDAGMADSVNTYAKPGKKRNYPQIIMAGFSPMFMHWDEDELTVLAIVRPGGTPIRSVGLKSSASGEFWGGMTKVFALPNGDELYEGIVIKEMTAKSLFPEGFEMSYIWNDFFQIVVRDEGGQEHRFPELRIGDYPQIQ